MNALAHRLAGWFVALALALTWTVDAGAQAPTGATVPAGKVMLLGLFHFDNPGLDAVKYQPVDVMQPAEQAYLQALSQRLARFAPTKVLLEYPDKSDAVMNQRYADYLAGRYELGRNELYQLGFRIAKLAGHARVYGFDQQAPAFQDKLWDYMPKAAPQTQDKVMALIATLSARYEHEHRNLGLRGVLAKLNSPQDDRENKGFYMLMNDVGADQRLFHGADSAAHWWQRNLRMYAMVQRHAGPGERVLVIAGSGHTAILRDLLRADSERSEEDVSPYF